MIFISLSVLVFSAFAVDPDCGEFGWGFGDWKGKVEIPKLDVTIHTKDVSVGVILGEIWSLAWSVWCFLMITVVNIYLLVMMICRYQYDLEHEHRRLSVDNDEEALHHFDVQGSTSSHNSHYDHRRSTEYESHRNEFDVESDSMPAQSDNCIRRFWRWMMKTHPVHFVQFQLFAGLAVVAIIGMLMKKMTHKIGFAGNLDPRPSGTCVSSSGMPSGHAITAVFALVFQLGFYYQAKKAAEKELEEPFVQEAAEERNGESYKLLPFIRKSLIAIAFYGPIPFARVWLQDHTWAQIGIGAPIGLIFALIHLRLTWNLGYSGAHAFDTFTFFHREVNVKYDSIYSDIHTVTTFPQKLRRFFVKESYFNGLKWGVHVTTFLVVLIIIVASLTWKRQ